VTKTKGFLKERANVNAGLPQTNEMSPPASVEVIEDDDVKLGKKGSREKMVDEGGCAGAGA
jgi:hypothetical protein